MNSNRLLTRTASIAVMVGLAATLGACGSSGGSDTGNDTGNSSGPSSASGDQGANAMPGKGKPAITMGDKNFAEEYLLGQLYSQALRAKGFTVKLKGNIGASAAIDKALTTGQIDGYPEYTGVIYTELAKLGDRPKSAEVTLKGATKFENGRGFDVLDATQFQDKDGVAVLNAFAKKNKLKTIPDLKSLKHFSYAGPPENKTRFQGVLGLQKAYDLHNFNFEPLKIPLQYTALDQKKVDTIAIFTTDGQLASNKYTVLTDTKGIFGFQQVVPVFKKSVVKAEGPAFSKTLNAVSKLLTTPVIIKLNQAVQIQQKDPAAVAKAFLKANGLS